MAAPRKATGRRTPAAAPEVEEKSLDEKLASAQASAMRLHSALKRAARGSAHKDAIERLSRRAFQFAAEINELRFVVEDEA